MSPALELINKKNRSTVLELELKIQYIIIFVKCEPLNEIFLLTL